MNEEHTMNDPDKATPRIFVTIGGALGLFLAILSIGFLLGFFPALLGDGGTVAKGMDHGWKFSLVFVGSMLAVGGVALLLKRTPLPELAIYLGMGMTGFSLLSALGGIVTEDYRSWQGNALRGLASGAIAGGVLYWVQHRRKKKSDVDTT